MPALLPRLVPLLAVGLVASGCQTPFVTDSDRIDRCITQQRQAHGDRFTQQQYRTACARWNADGELNDQGERTPTGG